MTRKVNLALPPCLKVGGSLRLALIPLPFPTAKRREAQSLIAAVKECTLALHWWTRPRALHDRKGSAAGVFPAQRQVITTAGQSPVPVREAEAPLRAKSGW